MTRHLYYPQTACSLEHIERDVRCTAIAANDYPLALAKANPNIHQPDQPLARSKPVWLPGSSNPSNASTAISTCTPQQHEHLKQLSHYCGGAATLALAELVDQFDLDKIAGDMNTFGGAGIGSAMSSASAMVKSIDRYDQLLKEYEDLRNHRAAPRTVKAKAMQLERAFKEMNQLFDKKGQHLLAKNNFLTREVRNQAGRVVRESIPVASTVDAQRLARLAKAGRVVGPGVIVLDGALRANKVGRMKRAGDPRWRKEAVVQGGAFAAGIVAGAAIGFVIAISPVGLIAGIVIGGSLALGADYLAQGFFDGAYDAWHR